MKTIDHLLDDISVIEYDAENDNPNCPENWWSVCNDKGIIAYFGSEHDAYAFRLSYINRLLNPITPLD